MQQRYRSKLHKYQFYCSKATYPEQLRDID
jgi:hypothetical protein